MHWLKTPSQCIIYGTSIYTYIFVRECGLGGIKTTAKKYRYRRLMQNVLNEIRLSHETLLDILAYYIAAPYCQRQ